MYDPFATNQNSNDEAEAAEAVADLQNAIAGVIEALESLEGAISDVEAHDSLELEWNARMEPDVHDMIQSVGLKAATYTKNLL